jgi:hypothetical protein
VNLRDLSRLHVFVLYAVIKCDAQESGVLCDINLVLSTIPTYNKVTNLLTLKSLVSTLLAYVLRKIGLDYMAEVYEFPQGNLSS